MATVYTAIFGSYDYLKPVLAPQSDNWKFVCFTDQPSESSIFDVYKRQHVKNWQIIRVQKNPLLSDTKNARNYKINFHKYIDDEVSIWVDGTFFVNTDLRLWCESYMRDRDFVTIHHPFDDCIYTDATSCLSGGKGNKWDILNQITDYHKEGLPENNGLISSGILMRKRKPEVIKACELWWEQVEKYSERDQIGFGYVHWKMPDVHVSEKWNYTKQEEFKHCPHRHKLFAESRAFQMARA